MEEQTIGAEATEQGRPVPDWFQHIPPNSSTAMHQQRGINHEMRGKVCPDCPHAFHPSGFPSLSLATGHTRDGTGTLSRRPVSPETILMNRSAALEVLVTFL